MNANETTIETPTAQFRPVGGGFSHLDESGDLLPGFHWLQRPTATFSRGLIQNVDGKTWVTDGKFMFCYGGNRPVMTESEEASRHSQSVREMRDNYIAKWYAANPGCAHPNPAYRM